MQYTLFCSTHGLFTKVTHITKTTVNQFQRIEIIWGRFSDQSGIKLEISNKTKKIRKFHI